MAVCLFCASSSAICHCIILLSSLYRFSLQPISLELAVCRVEQHYFYLSHPFNISAWVVATATRARRILPCHQQLESARFVTCTSLTDSPLLQLYLFTWATRLYCCYHSCWRSLPTIRGRAGEWREAISNLIKTWNHKSDCQHRWITLCQKQCFVCCPPSRVSKSFVFCIMHFSHKLILCIFTDKTFKIMF